jgi:hypothetical protein
VNSEIEHFRELGREANVLAVIIAGEPNASTASSQQECFPPALRSGPADVEPLAADARAEGDGKRLAVLKLLAAVLGVSLGELHKRDVIRRRQFALQCVAAGGLATLGLASVFALSSDAGFEMSGSEAVRVWADRHNLSLLRPVPDDAATSSAASEARRKYVNIIDGSLLPAGRFPWDVRGDAAHADTWTSSQALTALCSTSETPPAQAPRLLKTFRRMFDPAILLREDGAATGWEQRRGSPPRGAIAMWMTAALAVALQRGDLFNAAQLAELRDMLKTTTRVAEHYAAPDAGGWCMFSVMQRGGSDCYTSALALQALLQMQLGGLAWDGDPARRTAHLRSTHQWLVAAYDRELAPPGWGKYPRDRVQSFDGLTLQIYAVLLESENLGIGVLPADLVENAILHVEGCGQRGRNFPLATAEFDSTVMYHGEIRDENEGVTFVWHPWAVKACCELLRRHERDPLAPEHHTRVRRSLAKLVRLARESEAIGETRLFSISETLFGLSSVAQLPP